MRAGRNKLRGRLGRIHDALFERRDVVHDVEATAVGGKHDVVRLLLNDDPTHGRVRQSFLQWLPVLPVVERVE